MSRYRQLRGLILHYRRQCEYIEQERIKHERAMENVRYPRRFRFDGYRRSLIISDRVNRNPIERGRCRWCEQPTRNKRGRWHEDCVLAYSMAMGKQVRTITNEPLLGPGDCVLCGAVGAELDHEVALSVAHATGDEKALLWAYTLDNLRWLCHDCHVVKTKQDRQMLRWLEGKATQLTLMEV